MGRLSRPVVFLSPKGAERFLYESKQRKQSIDWGTLLVPFEFEEKELASVSKVYAFLEKLLPHPSPLELRGSTELQSKTVAHNRLASTTLQQIEQEIEYCRRASRIVQIHYVLSFDSVEALFDSKGLLKRLLLMLQEHEALILKTPLRSQLFERMDELIELLYSIRDTSLKVALQSIKVAVEVGYVHVGGERIWALSWEEVEKLQFHFDRLTSLFISESAILTPPIFGAFWFEGIDTTQQADENIFTGSALEYFFSCFTTSTKSRRALESSKAKMWKERALLASLLFHFLHDEILTESEKFQQTLSVLNRSKHWALDNPQVANLRERLVHEVERQLKKRGEKIPLL